MNLSEQHTGHKYKHKPKITKNRQMLIWRWARCFHWDADGEQTSSARTNAKAKMCCQLMVRRWTVHGRLGLTPPPTSEAHWLLCWIAGCWLQSFKSSVFFNPPSLSYKAKDLFLGCYHYSCLKHHSARWHKDFYSLPWWVHQRMWAVFDLPMSL